MPGIKVNPTDFSNQNFYVGLDVHKKSWAVTVRTSGIEVEHFTQPPDAALLSRHLKSRYPGANFFSAYEAGFSGTSAHQLLCEQGIRNCIVHAADIPQTNKELTNKTDIHDSRSLARYLESDLLNSIYIMSVEQQERRALFRQRQAKVKDIRRCVCRLHAMICYFGINIPVEFADKKYISKNFISWLNQVHLLTPQGTDVFQQYVQELTYQRQQLLSISRKLRKAVLQYYSEPYGCLLSIPGIGPVTATALLTETGDLSRFDDLNEFASYLGLIPSEQSSGEKIYGKRIQSRCNKHLRPLLVEAAWIAIRKSPSLLLYYKKHAGMNSKNAIIKVAKKLALICRAVALNKTKYVEYYSNIAVNKRGKLKPLSNSE